jgi:hypothetical protein
MAAFAVLPCTNRLAHARQRPMNISRLKRVRVFSLALHLVTGTTAQAESTTGALHDDPIRGQRLYQACIGGQSLDDNDVGPEHRGALGRRPDDLGRPTGDLYRASDLGRQMPGLMHIGHTPEELAEELRLSPATIRHWLAVVAAGNVRRRPRAPWMRGVMELATFLLPWREQRYAVRISEELLKLYHLVVSGCSATARREIYRRVVMIRTGADADEARAILVRAEQSFASWPVNRELRFRDVVHYLAVSEYLVFGNRTSTRIDMGRLINGRIPRHL